MAGGVWKEREMGLQSRRSTQVEVHPWEGPLCITCPAGTNSPLQHLPPPMAATLHLPATFSVQGSGANGHHKAGPYPTLPHLGRTPQVNTEGRRRDRDKCCCTNPVSWMSSIVVLFFLFPLLPFIIYSDFIVQVSNCNIL